MLTKEDLQNINKALAPRFDAINKKFEVQSKDLKAYSDHGLKDLKEYVDARLTTQTKELKAHIEERRRRDTERTSAHVPLAGMIEKGFAHVEELLRVRQEFQIFERTVQSKFHKLEEALHISLA